MFYEVLSGKIHRVRVTDANIDYIGSITIDITLAEAVGFFENQKVDVYDITNGSRLSTYVLYGERDSGVICLNGAAAQLIKVNDLVIIAGYALIERSEALKFTPKIVFVDENNKITRIQG